jgi:cytochrome bd-type quinol oxidase subunit 2
MMTPRDPVDRATQRSILATAAGAAVFVAALLAIGSTSRPQLGLVLIVAVFAGLALATFVRNRRTHEGTDERARDNHRRAATVSWYVVGLALVATMAWTQVRQGVVAAEPYGYLLTLQLVSYAGTSVWRRWRGL